MAHHTITLNYGKDGFKPDRDPLPVRKGDTISFQLGVAPPNSKFNIKMQDPQLFSVGEVNDGHTKVEVRQAASTKYHCKLLDAGGKVLSESGENKPGGGIEPDMT
jgi:hypothetical protein